jgi:hypothetical protein
MQFAESEGIEITWTKTCTLLLSTFLFTPTLFAQTGGTLNISNNSYTDTTDATTYAYYGQINTNINLGSVTIGSGWHDIETHFDSSDSNLFGNLFNPNAGSLNGPITDTGSIPEPSSLFLLLTLPPTLRRRRLTAQTV